MSFLNIKVYSLRIYEIQNELKFIKDTEFQSLFCTIINVFELLLNFFFPKL